MRHRLAIMALAWIGPATAQSIPGYGTVAIPKAQASDAGKLTVGADCFDKAKAIVASANQACRDRTTKLAPDLRAKLGINVTQVNYWSNEPTFANQAYGVEWLDSWQAIPSARLRPDGMPKSIEGGRTLNAILIPPAPVFTGGNTMTICKWTGSGEVYAGGDWSGPITKTAHSMTFRWSQGKPPRVWLELRKTDPVDPIRNLDCRLTTDRSDAIYAKPLLDYLKPFGVLRFLDWSRANSSPALVDWKDRSSDTGIGRAGNDGIALEHMIGLANANGSSPWFTVPWNADAKYHRHMAQLIHDTVPTGRQVYVEISNEVWNYSFWQTKQAEQEGMAAKLSDDRFQAALYRYAQKLTEIMPIWTEVFRDRPADLVRIMATQSGNAWTGQVIMEWNKSAVAKHIDAIAIAPYFSVDANRLTVDHDKNMQLLAESAKREISIPVKAYKLLADKYGKRLVAYEAGQHMIDPDNEARRAKMQRDSRMEGIYVEYLKDWRAATGDLITLYSATGPISKFGAWGLREYSGQPSEETPKLRGTVR